MSNELEELLVDGNEIDKKLVAEILSPYIRIDKNTNGISPLRAWNDLNAANKILIMLLARKAMIAMNMGIDEEGATAKEITENTGAAGGTIRRTLRELLEERILNQTKSQKYFIPNYSIEKIKEMLSGI